MFPGGTDKYNFKYANRAQIIPRMYNIWKIKQFIHFAAESSPVRKVFGSLRNPLLFNYFN